MGYIGTTVVLKEGRPSMGFHLLLGGGVGLRSGFLESVGRCTLAPN